MLVNTVNQDKNYDQLYLLICTSPLYMKAELTTVLCTVVQIMEQLSSTRDPSQRYIGQGQVGKGLRKLFHGLCTKVVLDFVVELPQDLWHKGDMQFQLKMRNYIL